MIINNYCDFNNNNELCDYFTNTINKITLESNLIPQQQQQEPTNKDDSNHSLFTRKILGDLKIHWLKIINEFWLLDLDIHSMLTNNSAYDYILPLTSTLNNIKNYLNQILKLQFVQIHHIVVQLCFHYMIKEFNIKC